jgi:rhamnose transport system ATP-binding protein
MTGLETSADQRPPVAASVPFIEARGVSMTFPGVRALQEVDFDVHPGEVHALIGENGAGKSTLIKILSGEIRSYEGELRVQGSRVDFGSPRDAIVAGIAVIPQELLLVSTLGAHENVFLGREPRTSWGLLDRRELIARAEPILATLGEADLGQEPVGSLEAGRRQVVAIARALSLDARLVVMDEPTTSLGSSEVERLERIVRELARNGVGVVYISHRLDEVLRLAQRITVLRDGRLVSTMVADGVSEQDLVRLMVGRVIERHELNPLPQDAAELLRVDRLSAPDPQRPSGYRLKDVSLSLRRGEILGLSGLVGAGRTELLLALAGARDQPHEGRVVLAGKPYAPMSPAHAREAGVVLLPEDRSLQAIFPDLSVQSNITITGLARLSPAGFIAGAREREAASELIERLRVRTPSGAVNIASLSGGNQQKALLGRCLFASPSVLLLDEPTRGIDLGAKAEIYDLIRDLAGGGFGIILCSSELSEILMLCHRVIVFREGRVAAVMDHHEASEERIMAAATGAVSTGAGSPEETERAGGHGTPPPAAVPPATRGRVPRLTRLERFTALFGLVAVTLLAIVFSPIRGGRLIFLDVGNLTDILRQVAEKGILAAGMTPVIISGGIDLSVGSVLALAATLTGLLLMHGGFGVVATAGIVLLVGAVAGLVNGAITARWRIQPFIVTLATMSAARGVARYISGGAAIPMGFGAHGAPESFRALGGTVLPYVPVPAVLFLVSVAGVHLLMARMRTGRYVYAIGDNEPAARLAGVRVGFNKALVYVLSGFLAGAAGFIHCAQLEQGNPNDGVAYELDAIAAVVIGGTSLSGGSGTVAGTLIGTLIIGIINNSMGLNNIDANLQLILKGAIILGAVWLQSRRK